MATKTSVKNKRQMVLLGALVIVLGYYLLHNFVFSGPSARSSGTPTRSAATPTKSPSGAESRQSGSSESGTTAGEKIQLLLNDRTPLELGLLANAAGGSAKPSERGNIFDYYKEPPPPPPKQPDPPPIKINYVQPNSVIAGTPRPFKLSVSGSAFPPDAQILLNGSPRQTKRLNEQTLSTDITAGEYSTQRSFTIEVKSQADPVKFYSNPLTLVVQPSPDPPFKYVGRIGDLAILEVGNKEFARLTRGSTVQGVWRIEAISDAGVEVIHTQLEIRKRVAMQDKGR
jgi:hypothetical protein